MLVKDYITSVLEQIEAGCIEVGFDIGTDDGKTVNMESHNRIKFTAIHKG